MTYDVCRHGGLRRKCETCDLAEENAHLESRLAALRAGIEAIVQPRHIARKLLADDDAKAKGTVGNKGGAR